MKKLVACNGEARCEAANYFNVFLSGKGKLNFVFMKIKFQRFGATSSFIKLFGLHRDTSESDSTKAGEADDAYEYYYKRGNIYYFRNSEGAKISIAYDEPQKDLIKGNKYKMDTINNPNS